jgi:hypothetical protein
MFHRGIVATRERRADRGAPGAGLTCRRNLGIMESET